MKHYLPTLMHTAKYLCAYLLISLTLGDVSYAQSRFSRRMAIPDLYDRRADTLFVDVETHDFGRAGLDAVPTLAYNHEFSGRNSYLGPCLTWYVADTQSTAIFNRLPMESGMRTTVHWHGANIPAWTDGGPHQFFDPGQSFTARFGVIDKPTTLWYHPHAEDLTYTQVQAGLAGLIIVRERGDTIAARLPDTYGFNDIPLVLQDIHFTDSATVDTTKGPGGAPDRTMVVNGGIQPFLEVGAQPVSFRILDGSTRNAYAIAFVTDTNDVANSKLPMHLVASDGGYLPDSSRVVDVLRTGPGIRNRVVVDFTGLTTPSEVFAVNIPSELPKGIVGSSQNRPPVDTIFLRIRVLSPIQPLATRPPYTLPGIPAVDTMPPDTSRIIRLTGQSGPMGDTTKFFGINNQQYDFNKINTIVKANSIEDWVIRNETNIAHPFHIHLVQFYVVSVEDTAGNAKPIRPELLGPKDDILVYPGEQITFRVRFHTYSQPRPFNLDSSAYMYHCHILTHEDGYYDGNAGTIAGRAPFGMMQQFAVWDGTFTNTNIDEPLAEEMTLFPNPAEDKLYLNAESQRMSTIRIFDVQGRLLLEQVLPPFTGSTPIDVSGIARGMILVEWSSPDGKQTKKVVLE